MQGLTVSELIDRIQATVDAARDSYVEIPHESSLELLALAPEWPESVLAFCQAELPASPTPDLSAGTLQTLVERGWIVCTGAMPPWSGNTYKMTPAQRRRLLRALQSRVRTLPVSLLDQARSASRFFAAARAENETGYPRVVEFWCRLLTPVGDSPPSEIDIADRLVSEVERTLSEAERLRLDGSADAAIWLDAAEPLASAAGGPIRVAAVRAQRALELFHRRVFDQRSLKNYLHRAELDAAFEELLGDEERWALHFIGSGGSGKTMFLRHLQSQVAPRYRLATARVDFDHLNPNYPLRSPGLLLLSFAEELKLDAAGAAVDYLQKLIPAVNEVHASLEAAHGAGKATQIGIDAPNFRNCLAIFVDALLALQRGGRQPVLILDTCEELSRLRYDGTLPPAVTETFRILEALHDGVRADDGAKPLRVVFSGRRPLAVSGAGWSWTGESLPERDYLRIRPIRGFSDDEARRMLDGYRQPDGERELVVPESFFDGILALSRERDALDLARLVLTEPQTPSVAAAGAPARYNPYDVVLYAGWAASGGIASAEEMRKAGRHYYVRERVVSRVRDDVRSWLPHLALLGRFDEELLRGLTGYGDELAELWSGIRRQEWIDVDRGAADARDAAPMTFWSVAVPIRERLAAYYADEEHEASARARAQVADVLERLTVDRDWAALTPAYFVVSAELLGDDPERAARWWAAVEAKILADEAWGWADQITAALLDRESPLESAPGDRPHTLDAPVRGLRAAVQIHLGIHEEALDSLWSAALHSIGAYAGGPAKRVLEFRARAGLIAAARYRASTPIVDRVIELLQQVPRLTEVLAGIDPPDELFGRTVQTEMALLDNCAEIAERFERWPAHEFAARADYRCHVLGKIVDAAELLALYAARLQAAGAQVDQTLIPNPPYGDVAPVLRTTALDWIPPRDVNRRMLLEYGRLFDGRFLSASITAIFSAAVASVERPTNLDEDRLVSLALRSDSDGTAADRLIYLFKASLRIAESREECNAHRTVPPLYVTSMQVAADEGHVSLVLESLRDARRRASPAVQTWLDTVGEYVNRRYLLTATPSNPQLLLAERQSVDGPAYDVGHFMGVMTTALDDVREHTVTEETVYSAKSAARALCKRLGFEVPEAKDDLDDVPQGWGPWFARYLLVQTFAPRKPDERARAEIERYLVDLYPAGLPVDLRFLERAPKSPPPVPYPLNPLANAPPLFWVVLAVVLAVVLVVFLGTVLLGVAWIAQLIAANVFGIRLTPLWSALAGLAGILLTVVVGSASVNLKRHHRLGRFLTNIDVEIAKPGEVGSAVRTRFEIFLLRHRRDTLVPLLQLSEPYAALARAAAVAGRERAPLRWRFLKFVCREFLRGVEYPVTIRLADVEPAFAAISWEGVFGMPGGMLRSFAPGRFAFRRTTGPARAVDEPFPGEMTVLSVSALRNSSSWAAPLLRLRHLARLSVGELRENRDGSVGVLMLQAEVIGAESEPRFVLDAGATETFGAGDIVRIFPNLRLLLLLGFDRSVAATRGTSDRITASLARAAAADLFRRGVPAVICVPGFPAESELAEKALDVIARAVVRTPSNVCRNLQSAVHDIRELVVEGLHLEGPLAMELAYDVCYYAVDRVSLKVSPIKDDARLAMRVSA